MAQNEEKKDGVSYVKPATPLRPNLSSLSEQTLKPKAENEDDTAYAGMSLNELLNRKKRVANDEQDMSYAATLIAQIKEENEKRKKKTSIILLSAIGGFVLLLIIIFAIFPSLAEIVTI